jgi:hypothetical protein
MLNPIFCWGLQFLASPVAKLGLALKQASVEARGDQIIATIERGKSS